MAVSVIIRIVFNHNPFLPPPLASLDASRATVYSTTRDHEPGQFAARDGSGNEQFDSLQTDGHKEFPACRKDRLVPFVVPRARGRLSPPLRESQDAQGRLRAGMRERVGARRLRETADQMRRVPKPTVSVAH